MKKVSGLAVKIGIAGAVGFGALATGFLLSRQGRHLVKEAWGGRRRSPMEDRVLDTLWKDPVLGRRGIDVEEIDDGRVALSGTVRTEAERGRCVNVTERVPGVVDVIDRLEVREPQRRRLPVPGRRAGRTDAH